MDQRTDYAGLGVLLEAGLVLGGLCVLRGLGPGHRPGGPVGDRGQQACSGRLGVACG